MNGSSHKGFDYAIVGGGIAGSVLASGLRHRHPQRSILLIEAGKDASKHPLVSSPFNAPLLRGSELDWNYTRVTQEHISHQPFYEDAGKALGGRSVINYGVVVPVIQSRHCEAYFTGCIELAWFNPHCLIDCNDIISIVFDEQSNDQ